MTFATSPTASNWTAAHTQMFSTLKNMFTTNPTTGQIERKNDRESWRELMNSLFNRPQATNVEQPSPCAFNRTNAKSGLSAIVVWPGGKTKELKHIYANLPSYDRFFEPFVGGGSVFMGINAREYYINDFCSDLMSLYKCVQDEDPEFLHYLDVIDMSMVKAGDFFIEKQEEIIELYNQFFCNTISDKDLKNVISNWCEANQDAILNILGEVGAFPCVMVKELSKYLCRRFKYMKKKDTTDIEMMNTHIEVAIKGALYINYRKLYNSKDIALNHKSFYIAIFFYIRQNVFGSKFSYNKKGEFCEAYGASSQLKNRLRSKLEYFSSQEVKEHFRNAELYNLDFEDFLLKTNPIESDFIFLDPPYDCNFTDYDANEFTQLDHKRLADYLLTNCKAKWMMIINKTDFIYNLYNHPGIYIQDYEKTYSCNMKNHNGRDTIHLLITNYYPTVEGVADMLTTTPASTIKEKKQEHPILAEMSEKSKSRTFVAQKETLLTSKNKTVMKSFNPSVFNNIVKNYCTNLHITSDAQAEYEIAHLSTTNGYDCADVIPYIYNLWLKKYPDFVSRYNSKDWVKAYEHYIKEAEEKCDWVHAHQLKEILASVRDLRGEAKQQQLRTQFFNLMSEIGVDPKLMEMSMTIDCWGWIKTISFITYLANKEAAGAIETPAVAESSVETCSTEPVLEEDKPAAPLVAESEVETCSSETPSIAVIDVEPTEPATIPIVEAETKVKKTRKRVKYLEIRQLSKEGELINTFKNIAEASKSGNFNHASISKCLSGIYKMAEGYKWVGITEDTKSPDTTLEAA